MQQSTSVSPATRIIPSHRMLIDVTPPTIDDPDCGVVPVVLTPSDSSSHEMELPTHTPLSSNNGAVEFSGKDIGQCDSSSFGGRMSEKEEKFESFGENEDADYDNGDNVTSDIVYILNHGGDGGQNFTSTEEISGKFQRFSPQRNSLRRNAWMRSSLKRANNTSSRSKLVGSNALASALFHNGNGSTSFNSSGRSSNCDEGEMQSDISLEEDVNDLNQKVQQLQEQVGSLAESQANTDDRYFKVKQENAILTQKIHMLEENIREVEVRSEEKLDHVEKRNKEYCQRLEREKELEVENYTIRLQNLERDHAQAEADAQNLRFHVERLKSEKADLENKLQDSFQTITQLENDFQRLEESSKRKSDQWEKERISSAHLVQELSQEVTMLQKRLKVETLSSSFSSDNVGETFESEMSFVAASKVEGGPEIDLKVRVSELEEEVRSLKDANVSLTDANEEMHAQMLNRGIEEGKNLISTVDAAPSSSISIADELGGMSEFQIRKALQEQQEANTHLRDYIDGILMNIMEKYPELLEVRK